jgi:hypothetical protein
MYRTAKTVYLKKKTYAVLPPEREEGEREK